MAKRDEVKEPTAAEKAQQEHEEKQAKIKEDNEKIARETEARIKSTKEANAKLEANSDKHLEDYYKAHPDKAPKKE